jgi:serine/threonine protein kinase/tetratricopeptide (TPR) repeat protein
MPPEISSPDLEQRLRPALADRYTLERELGRGGMARVYLAHDLKHDRPVALKVMHPHLGETLGAERFLLEIRVAAGLQHPHIVSVYDSGQTAGLLWFTMPYIEGESLRARLRREGQLPLDDAVTITREAAEALDYAHSRRILHRDIKPENILLSRGHALVADFGIARALASGDAGTRGSGEEERLTETGMSLGTPAYMSPEQASAERTLDARSDVYSLGCVLYEMLTGEPPFTGPTAHAILAKRFTGSAPSVRRVRPQLSAAVEGAVDRALALTPADRFDTAGELSHALLPSAAAPAATKPPGRSVAVLPFASLSPDPENEYFADGVTDELINALAKIGGLHVVSRTSAFAFKGKLEDVRAIGARLQVKSVLEGSVRRAGHRLRVTAQLIDVADGFLLWSDTFDRELEDVFAIQDEITRAIVGALKVKLFGSQQQVLVKPATDDLEAYTLYLKGRHFWNRRTEQALWQGLDCFQQAIARDPGFAQAHAGVADSYAILGFYAALPPTEAFPKAEAAALQALANDPALAEAHPALAYVHMYHTWDWQAAEREFAIAIELNPGYATAHQWYGNFLVVQGRFEESVAAFSKAIALDPLSTLKQAALGWSYYFARRHEEAAAQCRRALEFDAGYWVAHLWLGVALEELGALDEAIREFEEALRLSGRKVASLGYLGHALAIAGRTAEARQVLQDLVQLSAERYVSPYDIGVIHLGLGESDAALQWLDRAYAERDHQMTFLRVDPRLDGVRATPQFVGLMRKMGFSSAAPATGNSPS